MGSPLFSFSDEFIDSTCYGRSDADTYEIVADALEAGREVLATDATIEAFNAAVEWDDEGVVIVLPPDIEDAVLEYEWGSGDVSADPVLHRTVIRSRRPMEKAIERELEMS